MSLGLTIHLLLARIRNEVVIVAAKPGTASVYEAQRQQRRSEDERGSGQELLPTVVHLGPIV